MSLPIPFRSDALTWTWSRSLLKFSLRHTNFTTRKAKGGRVNGSNFEENCSPPPSRVETGRKKKGRKVAWGECKLETKWLCPFFFFFITRILVRLKWYTRMEKIKRYGEFYDKNRTYNFLVVKLITVLLYQSLVLFWMCPLIGQKDPLCDFPLINSWVAWGEDTLNHEEEIRPPILTGKKQGSFDVAIHPDENTRTAFDSPWTRLVRPSVGARWHRSGDLPGKTISLFPLTSSNLFSRLRETFHEH